jgi:hypothetical protein
MSTLDELLKELEEAMGEIERPKPASKIASAAFDKELALLTIEREEMNAHIARNEFLRLLVNHKIGFGIYVPEDNDFFTTKLFFGLYEGRSIVVGIQPDLTISPVVYRNGRYEFDDVDLGDMAGDWEDVQCKGIYTDGVKSDLMASGELIIDGLTLAK